MTGLGSCFISRNTIHTLQKIDKGFQVVVNLAIESVTLLNALCATVFPTMVQTVA